MARGWESKAVEDQISEREAAKLRAPGGAKLNAAMRARATERAALELSRAQTLKQLDSARHPNHRHALESALAALDARLASFET